MIGQLFEDVIAPRGPAILPFDRGIWRELFLRHLNSMAIRNFRNKHELAFRAATHVVRAKALSQTRASEDTS